MEHVCLPELHLSVIQFQTDITVYISEQEQNISESLNACVVYMFNVSITYIV